MAFVKKLARIVNTAIEGEPEYAAFQITETNKIIQFSEVKFVVENNIARLLNERMIDNNIVQPLIKKILNQNHTVTISYYEPNKDVTLYF
jgi:hypothetical protein